MTNKDNHSLHSGPVSYGVLANALDNAEVLMELLQNTVDKIDVTGQLKHEHINGYKTIELLAIPKSAPNLFGKLQQTLGMHELLRDTIKEQAWITADPPDYEWQGEHYLWKLTALKDETQWTIAQIMHTGPDYFTAWLTASQQHRKGALPWGYSIFDYTLINNNGMPIAINSESEFWATLGYLSIPLEDRADGNPNYWRSFYLVQDTV